MALSSNDSTRTTASFVRGFQTLSKKLQSDVNSLQLQINTLNAQIANLSTNSSSSISDIDAENLKVTLGLDKVDNVADADKEVSSKTQTELNKKQDVLGNKENSQIPISFVSGLSSELSGKQPLLTSSTKITMDKISDPYFANLKASDAIDAVNLNQALALKADNTKLANFDNITHVYNSRTWTSDNTYTDTTVNYKLSDLIFRPLLDPTSLPIVDITGTSTALITYTRVILNRINVIVVGYSSTRTMALPRINVCDHGDLVYFNVYTTNSNPGIHEIRSNMISAETTDVFTGQKSFVYNTDGIVVRFTPIASTNGGKSGQMFGFRLIKSTSSTSEVTNSANSRWMRIV